MGSQQPCQGRLTGRRQSGEYIQRWIFVLHGRMWTSLRGIGIFLRHPVRFSIQKQESITGDERKRGRGQAPCRVTFPAAHGLRVLRGDSLLLIASNGDKLFVGTDYVQVATVD